MKIVTVEQKYDGTNGHILTFAAVDDQNAIVGLCNLGEFNKGFTYLNSLWVNPDSRRSGIASLMIEEAVRRCILSERKGINLWVHKDNTGALALYEKMGFIWCQDPDPTSGLFMMIRSIQPLNISKAS